MRTLKLERRGCPFDTMDKSGAMKDSELDNYRYYARIEGNGRQMGNGTAVAFHLELTNHYFIADKPRAKHKVHPWCTKSGIYTHFSWSCDERGEDGYITQWGLSKQFKTLEGAKKAEILKVVNCFCKEMGLEEFEGLELVDKL